MLKAQDCVLLIKMLANPGKVWSQRQLSKELCISLSEVNAGIKRLLIAGLIRNDSELGSPKAITQSSLEFLIYSIKYFFPGQLGEYTRGMPTGIAAPVFEGQVVMDENLLPVWPYAKGNTKGLALNALYPSVPKAIDEHPDQEFYDILALVDVLRHGRARERKIASKLLEKKLNK